MIWIRFCTNIDVWYFLFMFDFDRHINPGCCLLLNRTPLPMISSRSADKLVSLSLSKTMMRAFGTIYPCTCSFHRRWFYFCPINGFRYALCFVILLQSELPHRYPMLLVFFYYRLIFIRGLKHIHLPTVHHICINFLFKFFWSRIKCIDLFPTGHCFKVCLALLYSLC